MTKADLAKELTLAAINNNLINAYVSEKDTYVHMNEQIAENVAAFYNKLIEKLNMTD